MSISASISLRIIDSGTKVTATPTKTLDILVRHGWCLINKNGYGCYLPVGDNETFDLQACKMDLASLMKILKEKEKIGELIGVDMYWDKTYIGGPVLLWGDKEASQKGIRTPMSFNLDSDRKILADYGHFKVTDVNWYLERLLPIFNQGDTFVEYFTYDEHV